LRYIRVRFESPFDELYEYRGEEDPAILDLIDVDSKAESGSASANSITAKDRGHSNQM
jgi:hypothetical protein